MFRCYYLQQFQLTTQNNLLHIKFHFENACITFYLFLTRFFFSWLFISIKSCANSLVLCQQQMKCTVLLYTTKVYQFTLELQDEITRYRLYL